MTLSLPPLSLYIHMPWCIKKCPYCDFNSHELKGNLAENEYIAALLTDWHQQSDSIMGRSLSSIFIGGGTPSLFSAASISTLLNAIDQHIPFPKDLEITLEANPGAAEQQQFRGFRKAGVNRLSIGVQSFQQDKLTGLGRVHSGNEAQKAISMAKKAGFDNLNIDLMFGLSSQTITDALSDLERANAFSPTHISWYQLSIEPHTAFYHSPPALPQDDTIWKMQVLGQQFLAENKYTQYEVSAYSQAQHQCQHNLNYWEFGDYIGIGAGAHSKLTNPATQAISRSWKTKNPRDYLDPKKPFIASENTVLESELAFEFMLNALRLTKRIPFQLLTERTGLSLKAISEKLTIAIDRNLLKINKKTKEFYTTKQGKLFLNDVLEIFI